MLTSKQLNLLNYLVKYFKSSEVAPSYDEMRLALGLKSKSGIHRLISALEERGFIKRLHNKARAIKVINNQTKFTSKYKLNQILKINIAHNEGNYFTNSTHLNELKNENLIAFKYCDEKGNINANTNPNGSIDNIAGIFNSKKNILGMMPHPERMVDDLISNKDGVNLFSSLLS